MIQKIQKLLSNYDRIEKYYIKINYFYFNKNYIFTFIKLKKKLKCHETNVNSLH